jgi:hypothetical protein
MLTVIVVIVIFLGLLYIYDPMQIFHKAWGRNSTFHANMRQQAAGIINNYNFDSIIFGTSMLENTSADEASEVFGGKFVNISMSASDFYERKLVLEYLMKKKSIKKVIYSLDADKYIRQKKGSKQYPIDSYNYLYDQNPFNDLNVYFNDKFIRCFIQFSKSKECIGDKKGTDRPGAWFQVKNHSVRYGGLDKWFAAKNNYQIKMVFRNISSTAQKVELGKIVSLKNIENKIEKAKKYVHETILNIVMEYPDTEFLMVFPPYSRMHYAKWAQYDLPSFEIHKAIVRYLAEESDKYENLNIYAFGDHEFVNEIKNYKDSKHYHYSINSWMLSAMHRDEGRLNGSNIDKYIEVITEENLNYDFVGLGKKISNYLQTK